MFSFIKWVQGNLSALKKNKGLWFTTLTTLSTLGILVSMYLINSMTSSVAHDTYMEERRSDINQLDSLLLSRYDSMLNMGSILSMNPSIIKSIKSKQDEEVKLLLEKTTQTINENVDISPIKIHFYSSTHEITGSQNLDIAKMVIETQQSVSGIVVNKDGVRILGMVPIIENNVSIGALEITESIHMIRDEFELLGKEFTFLTSKQQLVFMSLEHKQGQYKEINDEFSVYFHQYDSSFYLNIAKLDFDVLRAQKYANDTQFYTTYDNIVDLNGRTIGMALIGEDSSNANSFVKITQNMINSVTTVALGLVISLILFMF
jgi:hypothetical protein